MALALVLALTLLAADQPPPDAPGEPLPAGAPTEDYALTAWCFGALGEYLQIYDKVKPDLIDIDRMFGSSVKNEKEPYASDIAAARVELTVFAGALEAAEKASPRPIAPEGAKSIQLGQSIWRPAESKTRRELARAWLSWGLPDRCDATARALTVKANLLGQALTYNTPSPDAAKDPMAPPKDAEAPTPAPAEVPAAPTPEPGPVATAPAEQGVPDGPQTPDETPAAVAPPTASPEPAISAPAVAPDETPSAAPVDATAPPPGPNADAAPPTTPEPAVSAPPTAPDETPSATPLDAPAPGQDPAAEPPTPDPSPEPPAGPTP
ncbi:MAG TPA: hypothetical protein VII73_08940 [Caulobacteraceae bacterium]